MANVLTIPSHLKQGQAATLGIMILGLFFYPSLAKAQYAKTEPVDAAWSKGFDTITEANSEELIGILTSPGFDGRGTGQEGYIRAASFVAGRLAEYGFKPIGDNGTYFQNLPYRQVSADLKASSITLNEVSFGQGSIGFNQCQQSQRVEGEVVILRARGQATRFRDREKVEGKIVILATADVGSRFAQSVARSGAAGVIHLVDGDAQNTPSQIAPGRGALRNSGILAEISASQHDSLVKALGVKAEQLEVGANDGIEIETSDASGIIDLKAIEGPVMVPNVVGWLEGSDPEVNDEYIVIGAHLDHLGVSGDNLYPGADDNASGSAAILQIARALHENPTKPRRSILYIAFAAEERGLIGSKYYVENPILPLDKAVCMLNIDMIGRNEEKPDEPANENEDSIHLVGTKDYSKELHEAVLQANRHVGFRFEYDEEGVYRRSDHFSFADKGIPITFLFGGFNPYYHQTTDGLKGINYSKIANAARLNYMLITLAAENGRYELD